MESAVYGIVPEGGRRYQAAGIEGGRIKYFSHMQTVGLGVNSRGEIARSQGGVEIRKPSSKAGSVDDVMRKRADMGYGIDAARNIRVCEETGEVRAGASEATTADRELSQDERSESYTNNTLPFASLVAARAGKNLEVRWTLKHQPSRRNFHVHVRDQRCPQYVLRGEDLHVLDEGPG